MNNTRKQLTIQSMLIRLLEGNLQDHEFDFLCYWLGNNPDAINEYYDFLRDYEIIRMELSDESISEDFSCENNEFDEAIWQALWEDEKNAPSIEIMLPAEKQTEDYVLPVKIEHKASKFSVYTLVASVLFCVSFFLYFKFVPASQATPVARLARTVNAKWAAADNSLTDGSDLYPESLSLLKGYAEIICKNGAMLIIEAPAQFTIEKSHQIFLNSGRLVARINKVSDEVFVVRSPNSSIVDYGTEFAVQVDPSGGLETYVFDGQVDVRKGTDPMKFLSSLKLNEGEGAVAEVNKEIQKSSVDAGKYIRRDRFGIYYSASRGSAYDRWRMYVYKLHRDRSLVAHYTFEPDSMYPGMLVNAVSAKDQTSHGFLGDGSYNAPRSARGRWLPKKALQFDRRKAQAIRIPENPELCISRNITLSVWMKLDPALYNNPLGGHIISNRNGNAVNYQLAYFRDSERHKAFAYRIQFLRREKKSHASFLSSDEVEINPGKWHLLTVTHDNRKVRFYLDGKLISTNTLVFNGEPVLSDLLIGDVAGGKMAHPYKRFHGVLGEIAIFKRALKDSEIEEMYVAGSP